MKKLSILILCILLAGRCLAATYYVHPGGLGDATTIQAGINLADNGDTVIVADGTYTGHGNRHLVLNNIAITVESENGPDSCIINAEAMDSAFYIVNESDSAVIRGFGIIFGSNFGNYGGGGIYVHNTDITIENCKIAYCASDIGGGIALRGGCYATIKDCTIAMNNCTQSSSGGGAYVAAGGNTFINCNFANNSVEAPAVHAGAMYLYHGDTLFQNCIFEGNIANGAGGVFYGENADAEFINCVFVANRSTNNGGVAFLYGSTSNPADITLKNCIFWDNISESGSDLLYMAGAFLPDVLLTYSYCDIDPTEIGGWGTITDLGGNINVNPNFAKAGYWKGGTTYIMGDYHLRSRVGRYVPGTETWTVDTIHSPCIDAGDPADSVGAEPAGMNGEIINMGAYGGTVQASKSPYCNPAYGVLTADFNGDCRVDLTDLAELTNQWLQCNLEPQTMCWE